MNKQEILDEINKTKEYLANMEKVLEECEDERWHPNEKQLFWFIDSWCRTCVRDYRNLSVCCNEYYNTYNCFKTKEQAETEAEKILIRRQLENIARRLNKREKPDWIKCYKKKYYLGYTPINSRITLECTTTNIAQGTVYCLDENFLNIASQEIGEERLKAYLRGE